MYSIGGAGAAARLGAGPKRLQKRTTKAFPGIKAPGAILPSIQVNLKALKKA